MINEFPNVVVIKVGSSSLTNSVGDLDVNAISSLVSQISKLIVHRQTRVVIVTSGAVAAGRTSINSDSLHFSDDILTQFSSEFRATKHRSGMLRSSRAAVGQIRLVNAYQELLNKTGLLAAQLLLTSNELNERSAFENIRRTLLGLLLSGDTEQQQRHVPIVNANDVVTSGISENDNLAARVAISCNASLLILLTDTDGLYTADPRIDPTAKLIARVTDIDSALKFVSSNSSSVGTGGMRSKITAAVSAANGGVDTIIANAKSENVIEKALDRSTGTYISAVRQPLPGKDIYLGAIVQPQGKLLIHREAIKKIAIGNSSLLPVGIARVKVAGTDHHEFEAGAVVSLCGPDWREFGRGIVSVSSTVLRHVCSLSADLVDELVHIEDREINDIRSIVRKLVIAAQAVDLLPTADATSSGTISHALCGSADNSSNDLREFSDSGLRGSKRSQYYTYLDDSEAQRVANLITPDLSRYSADIDTECVRKAINGSLKRRGITHEEAILIARILKSRNNLLLRTKDIKMFVQASPLQRAMIRREGAFLLRQISETEDGAERLTTRLLPVVHRDRMVLYETETATVVARIE